MNSFCSIYIDRGATSSTPAATSSIPATTSSKCSWILRILAGLILTLLLIAAVGVPILVGPITSSETTTTTTSESYFQSSVIMPAYASRLSFEMSWSHLNSLSRHSITVRSPRMRHVPDIVDCCAHASPFMIIQLST